MGDHDGATEKRGFSRRDLIKRGAVAGGAAALVWSAPNIETLGFAPAGAQTTTGLIILSPESDDKNQNLGQNDCITPTPPGRACCGSSFGDAGKVDTFTFVNPIPDCNQIVVRTVTLDCDTGPKNPDIGQFGLIISSSDGTSCGDCVVLEGVLVSASGRTPLATLNNQPSELECDGIDASIPTCTLVDPSARLAVRLFCQSGP